MRDLVRESGLPASTLRFYLQEALLPPPERPTPNSALYGQQHLEAARALKRLRAMSPRIALPPLRRALALVMQGVEPEVAISLQSKVFDRGIAEDGAKMTLKELAKRAGVSDTAIRDLCARDVLVPLMIEGKPRFDGVDLEIAQMAVQLRRMSSEGIGAATEIASRIREASRLEIELRNGIAKGRTAQQAASISAQMQDWVNVWHAYLFARFRVREIAEHGLGATAERKKG